MTFLGLDLGSSSIKTGLLDLDAGTVTQVRSVPFPQPVPGLPPAWFEIDLNAVVALTRQVLDDLLSSVPNCEGILVSSQMGGVVLTDETGQAVTNYLSWRDQRVLQPLPDGENTYFGELKRRTTAADEELIGRELKPGSAASLLFWLAETSWLPRDAVAAMSLGEYVVAQLGHAQPRTEPTLALGTLNLSSRDWYSDWFARLGFGEIAWPQLCEISLPAGEYRCDSQIVPVYPAVGDQQAALFGADLREGELSINVSTGSQVSQLSDDRATGEFQTRPYFGGRFLNTITHLPAGRSLNALVELLTELARRSGHTVRDPWRIIAEEVELCPETELDVNLAFFASAVGDRGQIANIRLEDLSVGSLFRAAFEHMAENYLACALRLSPERNWKQVLLSGGLPQKVPVLREMIVEQFDCPHRIVDTPEETLLGLLKLARTIVSR